MPAYYNEIDPYCAQWLRNLIQANLIAPGDVDQRDIRDVVPSDLKSYQQCHFFAGIGGWSYALRLAGIPDDHQQIWTGSCPCQSFSQAGQQGGFADDRHLWPYWFHLISICKPTIVLGEQVASPLALQWLDLVFSDLEGTGYATAAADLCVAGVGAPHIRQRLWFVAKSDGGQPSDGELQRGGQQRLVSQNGKPMFVANPRPESRWAGFAGTDRATAAAGPKNNSTVECSGSFFLAIAQGTERLEQRSKPGWMQSGPADAGRLGDDGERLPIGIGDRRIQREAVGSSEGQAAERASNSFFLEQSPFGKMGLPRQSRQSRESFWSSVEFIPCIDGKSRPIEPGTFPLAYGVPARISKLRALGNAIVPQVAAEFIKASMI